MNQLLDSFYKYCKANLVNTVRALEDAPEDIRNLLK